jgi:hypothetical protein
MRGGEAFQMADLENALVFGSQHGKVVCFVERRGDWFLYQYMLARMQSGSCEGVMRRGGGRDNNCVACMEERGEVHGLGADFLGYDFGTVRMGVADTAQLRAR